MREACLLLPTRFTTKLWWDSKWLRDSSKALSFFKKCNIPVKSAVSRKIWRVLTFSLASIRLKLPSFIFLFYRFQGPDTDKHINLRTGTGILGTKTPHQVNHFFEDTNSKETVLHRSADAISETETNRNISRGYAGTGGKKDRTRPKNSQPQLKSGVLVQIVDGKGSQSLEFSRQQQPLQRLVQWAGRDSEITFPFSFNLVLFLGLFLLHSPLSSSLLFFSPLQSSQSGTIPFSVFLFIAPSAFVSFSLICMYCQPVSPFLPPGAVGQLCGWS